MHTWTLSYAQETGWSDVFPEADSPATLVLVFGAPEYVDDPTPIKELVEAFPTSHVVGCSTAGEIHGAEVRDGSLSVSVTRFDHTRLRHHWTSVETASESCDAGKALGGALVDEDLRAVLVLSEGVRVNGTALAGGLVDSVPSGVVITGGLAGDGDRFERTWVVADGVVRTSAAVAVGLYGDALDVRYGFQGGWDLFGPERLVTLSSGNVLYELDDRPALDLYEEYLGDLASELPSSGLLFPLSVRDAGTDRQRVRTILGVDRDNRSLTFAGDIPQGAYAQLMKANYDRLVAGAELAARAAGPFPDGVGLVIAISCVGRRLVLKSRIEDEVEATLDVFAKGTPQVGFYSYGELSPDGVGTCELHNQTMTLTAFTESQEN